jgi:hypothetical protein
MRQHATASTGLGDFSLTLASSVRRMWRIQKKEMDGLAATEVIGGRVRFCYCCFSRCLADVILANVVVLETLMSSEPLVCNFDVLKFLLGNKDIHRYCKSYDQSVYILLYIFSSDTQRPLKAYGEPDACD